VQIYIGGESRLVPLDECSVVTAPYRSQRPGDRHARRHRPHALAYERIIPIVDVTAKLLSNAMTQQLADE
jgi:heat-inducible transcriptional repressor